jgi:Fe2+ transport system protein FeoA
MTDAAGPRTLDRVAPGATVVLVGFAAALDRSASDELLSYGFQPHHVLEVVQQQPMTVVLCDHVELALEHAVARLIEVRSPAPA